MAKTKKMRRNDQEDRPESCSWRGSNRRLVRETRWNKKRIW